MRKRPEHQTSSPHAGFQTWNRRLCELRGCLGRRIQSDLVAIAVEPPDDDVVGPAPVPPNQAAFGIAQAIMLVLAGVTIRLVGVKIRCQRTPAMEAVWEAVCP